MTRRRELLAWAVAVLCGSAGALGWLVGVRVDPTGVKGPSNGVARELARIDGQLLASHVSRTVSSDPFRLEREPANVPFGASPPSARPLTPAQRPRLAVTGIFGPPWQAVVEGIPGREGSVVVVEGQAFGELRVRSIRRDTVVIAGADTTWRLIVRRPW